MGSEDALAAIWLEHRPAMLERVSLIERAVAALGAGELDESLRSGAQRAAHTLVGSAGTFGFMGASQAARLLEQEFVAPESGRVSDISKLVVTLHQELVQSAEDPAQVPSSEPTAARMRILLVDGDPEFSAQIADEAATMGLDCDIATDPRHARALQAERTPAIVLLDLNFPAAEMADAYALLSELTSAPAPIPVLVLADHDAFTDRIEAARRGGRAFLPKSLSPAEILDAATQSLARERLQATRVLLVDDDPAMLEAMRVLLERHRIDVSTLADPTRFWETLEEVAPELLVLDVDMPGVKGPELCRVVRNDRRWGQLAVIFVTAHTDPKTIEGVFQAGADDYLAKPIIEAELIMRVSNRLDRVRMHRIQAETDSLTGLANRGKSSEGLAQLLSLARRFSQPLSVAMLDLDHFKEVNDTHGHAAGDSVLRGLGECLRQDFRGDDVVGRWGGEEFIVGMYGMTRTDGRRRLTDTLERFTTKRFAGSQDSFAVSFSAGIAEYPLAGHDLGAVIAAADQALYRAKAAGRGRVLASEGRGPGGSPVSGHRVRAGTGEP